ncbi:hypothetical protein [Streptococcus equi]|uniref:hypothetical protein n=1 Tax=Streptococcus equi TaxID=1336 RepID=UPI001E63327C|nr:hypothetical protein [Streptococcus equi]
MVMLMRTLLFPVDNGMGTGLTGDVMHGLSMIYGLERSRGDKPAKKTIEKQKALTSQSFYCSLMLITSYCCRTIDVE